LTFDLLAVLTVKFLDMAVSKDGIVSELEDQITIIVHWEVA